MTKIYDDPNFNKGGSPDSEEMRTTVIDASSELTQWEQKAVDRKTLKSDLPVDAYNREPMTKVHGTSYPKIG